MNSQVDSVLKTVPVLRSTVILHYMTNYIANYFVLTLSNVHNENTPGY